MAFELSLPTGIKVVYVAGPFRSKNADGSPNAMGVQRNVMRAAEAALLIWKAGHVALCPHLNTIYFNGADGIPDQTWLVGDHELVRRSDAVYAIEGWKDSAGALREVQLAQELRIPVLTTKKGLMRWFARLKR